MSIETLSYHDFIHVNSALDEAAIVAVTDKAGVITYVNKKFCEISQYSRDELVGKTHQVVKSDYHSREFFIDLWRTISQGKVWEGEICNRAKSGSLYWVHTTIVPTLNASGEPEQYVAIRYDVTERKKIEEQLRQNAKQIEAINRELQDFASIAAHDLQEPLRKIQTFFDRIKIKSIDKLDEQSVDYMNRIQSAAKRMQALITGLLSYSRVMTKPHPFQRINLNEVIAYTVSDLEIRIERSGGRVELGDLPAIEADEVQMHQLFLNLIGNALKFSRPNIAPHIKVEAKILDSVPNGAEGPVCQISVSDNGIGFEEKYLDRIFAVFQRLHGRLEYEGTGIGLAVCRKIVERHNGTITAHSVLGEGSTFVITLPMRQKLKEQKNA